MRTQLFRCPGLALLLVLVLLALAGGSNAGPNAGSRASPPPGRFTVYVFLKPDCPISQQVTLPIRALHLRYGAQQVAFVGVFPDETLPTAALTRFATDYQVAFPLLPDVGHALTRRYGARITPEVVLTDAAGKALYQGRVDDQYARLGQRRPTVRRHDLADALAAAIAGQPIAVPRTEAVGCLID